MSTFKNTIENFNGEVIVSKSFDSKSEAKLCARRMKKEYDLINHAGHVVNYKAGVELFTNY